MTNWFQQIVASLDVCSARLPAKQEREKLSIRTGSHGVRSRLRFLYAGSSCPCCLKEYHLPERVHHHLRTSRRCRLELLARGPLPDPAIGCGSKEHVAYEDAHNRLVPYQVGAGPLLPSPPADPADDAEENIEVDFALLGRINSCLSQFHDFPDGFFCWRSYVRPSVVNPLLGRLTAKPWITWML